MYLDYQLLCHGSSHFLNLTKEKNFLNPYSNIMRAEDALY